MGCRNDTRRSIQLSKADIVDGTIFPPPPDSELFRYLPARNIDPEDPGLVKEAELLSHWLSGKELFPYVFSMPFFQDPGTAFFIGEESGGLNALRGEKVITVRNSPECILQEGNPLFPFYFATNIPKNAVSIPRH